MTRSQPRPALIAPTNNAKPIKELSIHIWVLFLQVAHFLQVVMSGTQVIEVPSCNNDIEAIRHCLQMHQPRSSTIRLYQHSYNAKQTWIIQPQLAGLWGLSKFRFILLHYSLEFDQNLRISSISKRHLSTKKGRVQFLGLIQQCLNLGIVFDHFSYKVAISALVSKKMALRSPMDSFPCHHVHNCIFSIDSLKYVFETGPSMRVPMAPSKFMSVWKHPNIRTSPFRWLFCGASMMISAAFQYKGWSKVTMVGRLCFIARLQKKSNIATMHDLSPEYILIIGKNLTDDSLGCWLRWCKICIIPCQFGVASLKLRETSHRILILMTEAMTPIPWNVPLPSIVMML